MAAHTLVIRRGGLGDTLLMMPILAALRRQRPTARLGIAGVLDYAEALVALGAADYAWSSERLRLWTAHTERGLDPAVREDLAACDHIVSDDAAVLQAGLAARVQVFAPQPRVQDQPLALQIGQQLGLAVDPAATTAPMRAPLAAEAPLWLAPGSGGAAKCWPRARWLALAAEVAAQGVAMAVLVGPVEVERDDPRRWPWPAPVAFVADLSTAALVPSLRSARALVGNDSGVTHLAALVRVPTVAVFGPTEPRVWAPQGAHVRVVGDPGSGAPDVAVERVLAALRALLPADW